ncbi:hypothetical protein P4597_23250 [Peribacillus simplex]|uniref:hypothetical protein n=1 Tax=Peribacillus simplex TaxID=1478 RepID=UPI002E20D049|nr:hypothetical protein [Peribacillus simplex]
MSTLKTSLLFLGRGHRGGTCGSLINPAKLITDEDYNRLAETAKKFSAIVQKS